MGSMANLVFKWRKLYQQGLLKRRLPLARLMPVQIAEQPAEVAIPEPMKPAPPLMRECMILEKAYVVTQSG
jgi:transposase-like protein